MTAQELRIGNWVSWYYDKDDQFQMDSVTKTNGRLVNPIPISEEWLLKFGFKPSNNYGHYFEQAQYVIYHCKINKISGHATMGIATFDDDGYRNGYVNFAWDFQYVHQLQNLYFALTGSELTIKE